MWTKVKNKLLINGVVWYNMTMNRVDIHKSTLHNNNNNLNNT